MSDSVILFWYFHIWTALGWIVLVLIAGTAELLLGVIGLELAFQVGSAVVGFIKTRAPTRDLRP